MKPLIKMTQAELLAEKQRCESYIFGSKISWFRSFDYWQDRLMGVFNLLDK